MPDITLSSSEAELFKCFRKNQDKIKALVEGDVFDVKNGTVILHVDQNGTFRQINVQKVSYRFRPGA